MTEDDEVICFERIDFRTLQPNAKYPLGQPAPTAGAIMFDNLATGEENPYTRANLLAICPTELRAAARFAMSPGSQHGDGSRARPAKDALLNGSDGGGSYGALEARLDNIFDVITAQNNRISALEQRTNATAHQPAVPPSAAKTVTSTFDEDPLGELTAADRALIAELKNASPADNLAATENSAIPKRATSPRFR